MTQQRWELVKELFATALTKPHPARREWLREATNRDSALYAEVDSLLSAHESIEETPTVDYYRQTVELEPVPDWAGQTVGHYEVTTRLGSGGMGEVWRARDTKLGREIAIKFLSRHAAADADSRERFRREARAASQLSHENICRLFDVGEHDGIPYLTMELLEGQTLAQRLAQQTPSIEQFLDIAIQTAEGLAAAHEASFVHRDIKPGNLFLTREGRVKITDFGLARRISARESESDQRITAIHMTVGTPSYMSPEQVRNSDLDHRADLFSFGVVLYEMATGELPFTGDGAPKVCAAVLRDTPNRPSVTNPSLPLEIERLILRLLEKDVSLRYQSARDLAAELKLLRRDKATLTAITALNLPAPPPPRPAKVGWLLPALVVVAVAAVGYSIWLSLPSPEPTITTLFSSPGFKGSPALSPNGDRVAFPWIGDQGGNEDIYVKFISEGPPRRITSHPAADSNPVFSPDGQKVAFLRRRDPAGYFTIPALGGAETMVAPAFTPPAQVGGHTLDWSPDGNWLAIADKPEQNANPGLYLLHLTTGERRVIPTKGRYVSSPAFSPDGEHLAFTQGPNFVAHDIHILTLASGAMRQVTSDGVLTAGLEWSPSGREIYFSSRRGGFFAIWRVPVSGGEPRHVTIAGQNAYSPALARQHSRMALIHRKENVNLWRLELNKPGAMATPVVETTRSAVAPDFSPDSSRLAYASDRQGTWEIYLTDIATGAYTQLTHMNGPHTGSPRWSPDGKWIAFDSRPKTQSDIFVISSDGGAARALTSDSAGDDIIPNWSRDGKWIYFNSNRDGADRLWRVPVSGGAAERVNEREATVGMEDPEGNGIYLSRRGSLWLTAGLNQPVGEAVLKDFAWREWYPAHGGIYFAKELPRSMQSLHFLNLATRKVTDLGQIGPRANRLGIFAVSGDGKWVVFDRSDFSDIELVLVENLR